MDDAHKVAIDVDRSLFHCIVLVYRHASTEGLINTPRGVFLLQQKEGIYMVAGAITVAEQQRVDLVKWAKSREKKNVYSQARPGNFWGTNGGKGKSDCSDTVAQLYKRVLGIDIGGNTSAQVSNAKAGKNGARIIEKPSGNQPDQSKMQVGDLIYYKGNTSHVDSVGHVEIYTGKNQCFGHGSGTGGTFKNLKDYCNSRTGSRKVLYIVRYIKDDGKPATVYHLGDRPLSKGMKSDDVAELQTLLISKLKYNLGTYAPRLKGGVKGADGDYGDKTVAAVKKEQKIIGVAQTGSADIVTIKGIIAHATGGVEPSSMQFVRVTGGMVNIRKGAGTKYAVVAVVKSGAEFELLGTDSKTGWHKIAYRSGTAWISYKMCDVVSQKYTEALPPELLPPAATPEPAPTEPTPGYAPRGLIIDLDQHSDLQNKKNDWAKAFKNFDLVILRCAVTRTYTKPVGIGKDADFEFMARKCNELKMPFWVYYYGKSKSESDCRKEAQFAYKMANPYNPVGYYYDIEEGILTEKGVAAFADELRKLGVQKVGAYISQTLYAKFRKTVDAKYDTLWIPRYGKNTGKKDDNYKPIYACDLWQYTSVGEISGIMDNTLDLNVLMPKSKKSLAYFREHKAVA